MYGDSGYEVATERYSVYVEVGVQSMFRNAERTFTTAERTFTTAECTFRSGERKTNACSCQIGTGCIKKSGSPCLVLSEWASVLIIYRYSYLQT